MTSINEQLSAGQQEYSNNSKTNYFTFSPGENRLRILTTGEVIATHFFGKGQTAHTCYGVEKGCPFHGSGAPKDKDGKEKRPSIKYTCYILDRNDSEQKVQLADLPYSVIKQIGDYQANIDYQFDDFPMPYDVTVKFNPDASPNDMYKVMPSPRREAVAEEIIAKLTEKMSEVTPKQKVQRKKDWQMKKHTEEGLIKEVVKESREEFVNRVNAETAEKRAKGELPDAEDDRIEYPKDDISPEDIPF